MKKIIILDNSIIYQGQLACMAIVVILTKEKLTPLLL